MQPVHKFIRRNCPSCGLDNSSVSALVSPSDEPTKMGWDELIERFEGLRRDQVFFCFSRCQSCRLLYCQEYFSQETLDALYSSLSPNTDVGGLLATKRTQANYVKYFGSQVNDKEKFLDVGSDIGLLSRAAIDKFGGEALCIEPNKSVWQEIQTLLGPSAEIRESLPDQIDGNQVTRVAIIHVLDHLLEPKEFLVRLSELVGPNVEVLAVVHNEKSLLRYFLSSSWPPFTLQHSQLYSKHSLADLFSRSGYTKVRIRRTLNYVGLRHILKNLSNILGLTVLVKSINKLPDWQVPAFLGNIYILARTK